MNTLNKSTDTPQLFLDGIGEIHFLNNNVRISWGTFIEDSQVKTETKTTTEQPFFKYEVRTILPITSFLSALRAQYDLYLKLVDNNVIPSGTLEQLKDQLTDNTASPELVLK